jgi:hypothetical protein
MALGCATHAYTITDRDGGDVNSSGILTAVSWNRVLNEVSTAAAIIGVSGLECCAELGGIRSWRHQLNIYRVTETGASGLVWTGPIINVDWNQDQVSISAVDVLGWLERRVPHQDFAFDLTDLTEIAAALIDDGFQPDDPGHTTTVIGPCNVLGGRTYAANVGQTLDHVRDLADTGIDFTAVGASVIVLPDDFCDVVGRLSDDDLPSGLSVAEDGASLATRVIVAGTEDGDPVGTAGGTNAYYGLLERYIEQRNIPDQAAADAAAAGALAPLLAVPVFIDTQDITLSPLADVDVSNLVPGWCLDVTSDSTCRTITQRLKITGLQVSEDGGTEGSPGQEKVTIQVAAHGNELEVS